MRIITRPSKTAKLIHISAETSAYIIVRSIKEARRVFHRAEEMGLDIPFPLSYSEFIYGLYSGKNIKGFLIDDADALLQSLSKGVPILAISISESDE